MSIIGRKKEPAEKGAAASDSPPSALLVRVGAKGQSYPLSRQAVVGRLDSCDIPINDSSVSREHARINQMGDDYSVEDLGSTNGTMVNGQTIRGVVRLKPGDMITFGSVEFRLERDASQGFRFASPRPAETSGGTGVFPLVSEQNGETDPPAQPQVEEDESDHLLNEPPQEDLRPYTAPIKSPAQQAASAIRVPPKPATEPPATIAEPPSEALAEKRAIDQRPLSQPASIVEPPSQTPTEANAVLDEVRSTTARLNDLIEQLTQQADENRAHLKEARTQLTDQQSQQNERVRSLQSALQDVPEQSVPESEIATLRKTLAELSHDPRDIELLVKLGRHTSTITAMVEEHTKLRQIAAGIQEKLSQGD